MTLLKVSKSLIKKLFYKENLLVFYLDSYLYGATFNNQVRNLSNFRCDYSTKDKGSLDSHVKTGLKSEEIQKCFHCEFKSCTSYGLANHIKMSHPELKNTQHDCERYVFFLY